MPERSDFMSVRVIRKIRQKMSIPKKDNVLVAYDVEHFLDSLPEKPLFDLVITSPPYDIGKEYEKRMPLADRKSVV